jgi:uncharacterized protein YgiM (DUF1202 family)
MAVPDWQRGDTVLAGGEHVVVIEVSNDDGWVRVQYPDGDVVWTPPEAIKVLGGER